MFKTNLIEAVQKKKLLKEDRETAFRWLMGHLTGFARNGDGLANNQGHKITIGPNNGHGGYFKLWDNGKDTGISDHVIDDIRHKDTGEVIRKGFASRVKDYLSGN